MVDAFVPIDFVVGSQQERQHFGFGHFGMGVGCFVGHHQGHHLWFGQRGGEHKKSDEQKAQVHHWSEIYAGGLFF